MALTQQQLDYIIKLPVPQILKHIEEGRVVFPTDLSKYSSHPKFKEIAGLISSVPDPAALKEYHEIRELLAGNRQDTSLPVKMKNFIARYSSSEPLKEKVTEIRGSLAELTRSAEDNDWESVDKESVSALLTHRMRYPATVHENEIDNIVWRLIDKSRQGEVRRYMQDFPSGIHRNECNAILDAQELWRGVSTDPDPVTLSDYIEEEFASPFINDAISLLERTRRSEIEEMLANPGKYSAESIKLFIENGIFTEQELFDAKVATPETLRLLYDNTQIGGFEQAENKNPRLQKGATDIFLFGIPASGKTCVLLGLLGAKEFAYDSTSPEGGEYAQYLEMHRSNGLVPGRTYTNFVAQILGRIRPESTPGTTFPVNLIEMSGEEFATQIAYNPTGTADFEEMGTGATALLTNGNQKVIFIVIDPSANGILRLAIKNAKDGSERTISLQQDLIIKRIVDMLAKNPAVLKHTNAIHFIMTKADTIGSTRTEREEIAKQRLRTLYGQSVDMIKELAAKYSFNTTSHYNPKVFPFSLGRFYVGNLFEYDDTDANDLIEVMKSLTQGEKPKSFFSDFKRVIN